MKVNLVTDKGPFGVELRNACLAIAIFFLASIALGILVHPGTLTTSSTLVGFVLALLGNLALLFGCLKYNAMLVLGWLIFAAFYFISWPIAVLGVIFNFGGYRQASEFNNIIFIILEYIINLIFVAYFTHLVYSFYVQLKNRQSNPQHAVVV